MHKRSVVVLWLRVSMKVVELVELTAQMERKCLQGRKEQQNIHFKLTSGKARQNTGFALIRELCMTAVLWGMQSSMLFRCRLLFLCKDICAPQRSKHQSSFWHWRILAKSTLAGRAKHSIASATKLKSCFLCLCDSVGSDRTRARAPLMLAQTWILSITL